MYLFILYVIENVSITIKNGKLVSCRYVRNFARGNKLHELKVQRKYKERSILFQSETK